MTTKTIKRIPTFLVLAVIGVAAMVVWPTLKASLVREDENVAVVTISFDPPQRSGYPPSGRTLVDHVMFQITMAEVFFPKEFVTKSPQIRTIRPQRGTNSGSARIEVHAEQVYGKRLSCSIAYPGLPTSTMSKNGPTSVRCFISVKMSG